MTMTGGMVLDDDCKKFNVNDNNALARMAWSSSTTSSARRVVCRTHPPTAAIAMSGPTTTTTSATITTDARAAFPTIAIVVAIASESYISSAAFSIARPIDVACAMSRGVCIGSRIVAT